MLTHLPAHNQTLSRLFGTTLAPVFVMSVMMIAVMMVVVVEVPHGPPAPGTSSETPSVEVLIWRRTIPVVGSPSVVGRSSSEWWGTILPWRWWLLVEVSPP